MYFLLTVIIISWFEHPPQLPQFPLQEPPPQPPCLCSRMMLLTQSTTTRSTIIPTITFPIGSSYIRITEQLLIHTQGIYPAVYCTTRDFLHTALCIRFTKPESADAQAAAFCIRLYASVRQIPGPASRPGNYLSFIRYNVLSLRLQRLQPFGSAPALTYAYGIILQLPRS